MFTILRRLTAEEGASFGKVIDGDLRVVELGSWLQPTKADYYLQRRSQVQMGRTINVVSSHATNYPQYATYYLEPPPPQLQEQERQGDINLNVLV